MRYHELTEISNLKSHDYDDKEIRDRIASMTRQGGWTTVGKFGDVFVRQLEWGNEIDYRVVKDKVTIGIANTVKATYSGVPGLVVREIGVIWEEQYAGYGKLLYNVMLDQGHVLISGGTQTPDGKKMWSWLLKQPNVHCYMTNFQWEDDDYFPFEPIINGKMKRDPWKHDDARLIASRQPITQPPKPQS
jgi:hypothetical protein